MNLFEILEGNHKCVERVTADQMKIYLKDAQNDINSGSSLRINNLSTALLLAYAGRLNQCLTESEYNQFNSILNMATVKLRNSLQSDPMAVTIIKHVKESPNL